MKDSFLIVNTVSDDPFAIDVAHHFGQRSEIADYISLKIFANSECCPRFISDETDLKNLGNNLRGQTVVIVSTCCGSASLSTSPAAPPSSPRKFRSWAA